jgi:hypothetical protein
MKTISATALSRNLRRVLESLLSDREEIVIERKHQQIARLVPVPIQQTALEAMSDLYRTLPQDAAATWETDRRRGDRRAA